MQNILSIEELKNQGILSNSEITIADLEQAKKTLEYVHKMTAQCIQDGNGPFFAIIKDKNGNIIAQEANSVIKTSCSSAHAEPCLMCIGGIMWSGIKTVYYSVTSEEVEQITGFDEGFKPNWLNEFKNRGIKVYGNICSKVGKEVLKQYISSGQKVYNPSR